MTKKKNHDIVMTMVEVGVMAALGFVLDELSGIMFKGVFVNGGSIGIAMVCVLVMAFRRGFVPALATGVVMGLLDLATGPYIIPGDAWRAFVQVFLDYVAAYPMVAFAAIFRKAFLNAEEKQKKVLFLCLGSILGGLLKLFAHFLSGILFWADPSGFAFSWNWMNPYLYCFLYNALYVLPCLVLSLGFLLVLFWRIPSLLKEPNRLYERKAAETKKEEDD
ncbi:MAG: energy-coupled thiamine transporter ThiT [Candidatus Enteromonas sp.]|nr:energy-coupled thiamine transporter ThiT [bacterium]MDY6100637.1 energy-coupled thiamine transporter ThiT [Candidatus Enteromonas sp.]